jgi:hypothetical protein
MSVDIFTTNPQYYTGRYNGRWLVRGVQHIADRQSFQTMLALSRPSDVGVSMAPYTAFWNQISGFTPVGSLRLFSDSVLPPTGAISTPPLKGRPTMTLVEGRWQSSWTDRRVRAVA